MHPVARPVARNSLLFLPHCGRQAACVQHLSLDSALHIPAQETTQPSLVMTSVRSASFQANSCGKKCARRTPYVSGLPHGSATLANRHIARRSCKYCSHPHIPSESAPRSECLAVEGFGDVVHGDTQAATHASIRPSAEVGLRRATFVIIIYDAGCPRRFVILRGGPCNRHRPMFLVISIGALSCCNVQLGAWVHTHLGPRCCRKWRPTSQSAAVFVSPNHARVL